MKLLFAFLMFLTLPLTYIGGWYVVNLSGIAEEARIFLGIFGGAILVFQGTIAALLTISYYNETKAFKL